MLSLLVVSWRVMVPTRRRRMVLLFCRIFLGFEYGQRDDHASHEEFYIQPTRPVEYAPRADCIDQPRKRANQFVSAPERQSESRIGSNRCARDDGRGDERTGWSGNFQRPHTASRTGRGWTLSLLCGVPMSTDCKQKRLPPVVDRGRWRRMRLPRFGVCCVCVCRERMC